VVTTILRHLVACSLVIMLLVWSGPARLFCFRYDQHSQQHLPHSPVNAMAGVFFASACNPCADLTL